MTHFMFIYCSWHVKLMLKRAQNRKRAKSRWMKAKNTIKACNYMRKSYAAERRWRGHNRYNAHAFDERPALAEDDYDLNRMRYLKKMKLLRD